MYLGYATQRNTVSMLIIIVNINKQFEKLGQNIGITILVKSCIGRVLKMSQKLIFLVCTDRPLAEGF
jgi:hypothetical protein